MSACTLVNTTPNYDLPQNYDRLGVGLYKFVLDGVTAGVLEVLGTGDGRSAFKNSGQTAAGGTGALGVYDIFTAGAPGGTITGQAWNTSLANSFGNPSAWMRCRFVGSTIEFCLKRGSGTASGGEMFLNIAFSRGGFGNGSASATAIPGAADSQFILGAGTTGISVSTAGDFSGLVIASAIDVKQHVWWASRAPISGGAVPFSLTWHGQTSNSYGFAFFLDCILDAAAADTFPYVTGTMTGSTTLWTTAAGGGGTLPTAGADQNTSNVWSYSSQSLTWKRYMFSMIKTSPSPSVLGAGSIPGTDDSVQGRILPLYWFESTGSAASRNWKGKSLFFRGCTKYVEYPNTINIATTRPYLGLGFVLTPAKTSQSYTSSAAGSNSTGYTEPELNTYSLGAPSIGARSPAAGAISTSQSISFAITEDQAISNLTITAAFTNIGREETIYTNGAYSTNYSSSTAVVGTSPDTTYTITRTDGWPDSFTLKISCGDPAGNSVSATTAYTVSAYLPSVSSISPAGGSALAAVTTPVAFTVSDPTRLLRVNVFAVYPDLSNREELVFSQGPGTTTLEANYSGTATWTGATQVAFTGLYRTGGWPAAPTIKVVATDADNNAVSTTITAYTLTPGYAPTISSVSPAAGSALSLVTTPVTFTAADPTGVLRVQVFASYANTGRVETVFDGAGGATTFKTGYSSGSTVTWTGTTSAAFSVVRDNGWDDAPTLSIVVTDLDGNVVTSSPNYTLTPGYLPTVSGVSPSPGAVSASQAIAFTVADPTSLQKVIVRAVYANLGVTETIYDGSAFKAPYDTYSTVSGTNSKAFSVRHNVGWRDSSFSIVILGYDADALEVSSTQSYTTSSYLPSIGSISPAAASSISTTQALTCTVSDLTNLQRVLVRAYFPALDRTETVYDGSAVQDPYQTYSTVTLTGTTSAAISVRRNAGWPDDVTLKVFAYDADVHEVSSSTAYTLASTAAPSVGSVSPAALSSISTTQALSFTVSDPTALGKVFVSVYYASTGRYEHVYDSSAILAPYDTYSTATPSGSTSIAFSIRRNSGWMDAPVVKVFVIDADGNYGSSSTSYTLASSSVPSIGSISPAGGSSIATSATLAVTASDPTGLQLAKVEVYYATLGRREVIYDGTAFVAPYDTYSSVVSTSTSKAFSLKHNVGWPDAPVVKVYALDTEGQAASASTSYSLASGAAPTIGSISPAGGSTIANTDALSFTVASATGLANVTVEATFASTGTTETVYSASTLRSPYAALSSAVASGSTSIAFSIARNPAWMGDVSLYIEARDVNGYVTSQTLSYSVTGSIVPTIGTPSPGAGAISPSASIAVALTTSAGIAKIVAYAQFGTSESEMIYASGFGPAYDAGSTLTGTSTSKTLTIARDDGWPDAFTLHIELTDNNGNSATQSTSYTMASSVNPYVTNISPTPGEINSDDPVTFDVVVDAGELLTFLVFVRFPATADYEVLWDGAELAPKYEANSTVTTISAGKHYRVTALRKGGWPAPPTFAPRALTALGKGIL